MFGGHDHIRCLNTCETYNTKENGKWMTIASMLEPRRGCGAVEKDGCVYIVGGTNGSCSLKSTEIYNTQTNKFICGPDLNTPRANVAVAFIGTFKGFESVGLVKLLLLINLKFKVISFLLSVVLMESNFLERLNY